VRGPEGGSARANGQAKGDAEARYSRTAAPSQCILAPSHSRSVAPHERAFQHAPEESVRFARDRRYHRQRIFRRSLCAWPLSPLIARNRPPRSPPARLSCVLRRRTAGSIWRRRVRPD